MLQKEFDRLERLIRVVSRKIQLNEQKITEVEENTTSSAISAFTRYVPTEYTEGDGVLDSVTTLNEFESGSTIVTLNGLEQIKGEAYTEVNNKTIQFSEVIDEDIVIGIKYIRSN